MAGLAVTTPLYPPLVPSALTGQGILRGFAPHPFLPVLVESRTGGSWLTWTIDASEYEVSGLPAGAYRVRALDLFGRLTFASGAMVRDGSTIEPARLWTKLDLDEPDSRQVMGFVRWENGAPAVKAAVFMQNTYNFRKYMRRVETDEQGYFRFMDVPGDEPYFTFAVPAGETNAVRTFEYFGMGSLQREALACAGTAPAPSDGRPARRVPTNQTSSPGNGPRAVFAGPRQRADPSARPPRGQDRAGPLDVARRALRQV